MTVTNLMNYQRKAIMWNEWKKGIPMVSVTTTPHSQRFSDAIAYPF